MEINKLSVWQKGKIMINNDPNFWRQDECGVWIGWQYYGDRNSEYGWEIDHIKPVSNNGGEGLSNLRPLHWLNNASKQDGKFVCIVKSSGIKNIKIN